MLTGAEIDWAGVTTLLCDADGNLFPSEEPAFVASAEVTNRFMRAHGVETAFAPEELRRATTGKNFRATAIELAVAHGIALGPELAAPPGSRPAAAAAGGGVLRVAALDRWVAEERQIVTAHLRARLRPDPHVSDPLRALDRRFMLAAVSSSAMSRLAACFEATGLAPLFPEHRRFSAEDSLPVPASKPDPAVYVHAGAALGIALEQGLAIEDSLAGAQAAVAAGFRTVGNLLFVPPEEQAERVAALRQAGVVAIISSWWDLVT